MPVTSCSRSTGTPRRRAASRRNTRSGVGVAVRRTSSSVSTASRAVSAGSAFTPSRPASRPRIAFCSDSGKVRPMAITSPTDCIWVVSVDEVPGSFSNAQRGTFVTT